MVAWMLSVRFTNKYFSIDTMSKRLHMYWIKSIVQLTCCSFIFFSVGKSKIVRTTALSCVPEEILSNSFLDYWSRSFSFAIALKNSIIFSGRSDVSCDLCLIEAKRVHIGTRNNRFGDGNYSGMCRYHLCWRYLQFHWRL